MIFQDIKSKAINSVHSNLQDLCDVKFFVKYDYNQEEIPAPSQPPIADDDKRRAIKDMTPNVFKKILDHLFRGIVPLTSINDARRTKVTCRMFQLKDLEELTTKFLKYRLNTNNIIVYLKHACKYKCQDVEEVIVN